MKGSDLKKIAKDSGLTIDEIALKSGIPKRTVSSLYKKEYVEKHYLDSVQFLMQKDAKKETSTGPDEKTITLALQLISETVQMVKEQNAIFTKIINKGLDSGAIAWNAEKTELIEKKGK